MTKRFLTTVVITIILSNGVFFGSKNEPSLIGGNLEACINNFKNSDSEEIKKIVNKVGGLLEFYKEQPCQKKIELLKNNFSYVIPDSDPGSIQNFNFFYVNCKKVELYIKYINNMNKQYVSNIFFKMIFKSYEEKLKDNLELLDAFKNNEYINGLKKLNTKEFVDKEILPENSHYVLKGKNKILVENFKIFLNDVKNVFGFLALSHLEECNYDNDENIIKNEIYNKEKNIHIENLNNKVPQDFVTQTNEIENKDGNENNNKKKVKPKNFDLNLEAFAQDNPLIVFAVLFLSGSIIWKLFPLSGLLEQASQSVEEISN